MEEREQQQGQPGNQQPQNQPGKQPQKQPGSQEQRNPEKEQDVERPVGGAERQEGEDSGQQKR